MAIRSVATVAMLAAGALAGFDPSSNKNIAVYWGTYIHVKTRG